MKAYSNHTEINDFDENVYVDGYDTRKNYISKYLVTKSNSFLNDFINIFQVHAFKEEMLYTLSNNNFVNKLTPSDKALSVMFYVLRKNGYPITYNDVLPYTTKNKLCFSKIIVKNFPYQEITKEYLSNVFYRIQKELKKEGNILEFYKIYEENKCSKVDLICIAYFLRNDDELSESYEKYQLQRFSSLHEIKKNIKKIKKMKILKKDRIFKKKDIFKILQKNMRSYK